MTNLIHIQKADGELELFDAAKLDQSLKRAGASAPMRHHVIARISGELREGMTTEEIYRHAFEYLKKDTQPAVAARYSVKRAIFALGPSGFPFEQFIAEIFRAHGWHTRTGVFLNGRCASHEVDIVLDKKGRRAGIEAKFHNTAAGKTDIKDALYVRARFEDLARAPEETSRLDEGWLVTNTRFTRNAIRYAQCSNLTLIGWDYPHTNNLMQFIESASVHPLTCLTTLSAGQKQRLLDAKIVLCKSVQSAHILEEYGVRPDRIPSVLDEARHLCSVDGSR